MGSTQGEIRIGVAHQARLPDNRLECKDLSPDPEFIREREEVRWIPNMMLDGDLVMYLRAARSMAAFAGMCDGGSAEDGCIAASRDGTTSNAMDVLHDSGYDPGKALQTLMKCPMPKGVDKRWSEEESKRFVKGLRQYGKNFFRIRKELLSHKETPELVEYYYLWKKTPAANNNRPHRRRRQGSLRRSRNTRNNKNGISKEEVKDEGNNSRPSSNPKEQGDGSSGSEDYNSYDDSDSKENGGYRCQHCFTKKSRDWQHATSGPKQGALLCYTCRSYYKQFGELPPVGRSEAPYLFQPVQSLESPETSPRRMRTRNKAKETPSKEKPKGKKSDRSTPDLDFEKKLNGVNDRSPMSNSNSNSPGEKPKKKNKSDSGVTGRKRVLELDDDDDEEQQSKRKRDNGTDSPLGSDISDSDSADEADDSNSLPSTVIADEKDLTKLESPSIETNPPATVAVVQPDEPDSINKIIVGEASSQIVTTIADSLDTTKIATSGSNDKEYDVPSERNDEDSKNNLMTSDILSTAPYVDEKHQEQHQEYYDSPVISSADTHLSLNHHIPRSSMDEISYNNNNDEDHMVRTTTESVIIKSEAGIFDSPSPEQDEILPPVLLSSDDSYIIPKEEMPTLRISSNIRDENSSSFSPPLLSTIPNGFSTSPSGVVAAGPVISTSVPGYENNAVGVNVDNIKLERNTNLCDDSLDNPQQQNPRIRVSESLLQRSSPSVTRQSDSPVQLTAYSHIPPPESLGSHAAIGDQTADKSHSQSVLLSPYGPPALPPFNETDQNDKTSNINMSASSSITSQHHHPVFHPYYFPPPSTHMDKMDPTTSYMSQKSNGLQQMEPQDLKVKQEVLPPDQRPPSVDPLQSLKEVKVPGYATPSSSISQQQPLLSVSTNSSLSMSSNVDSTPSMSLNSASLLPPSMHVANIKKEVMDAYGSPASIPMCMKSPTVVSLKASSDLSRNLSPSRQSPSYSSGMVQSAQSPPPHAGVASNRSPTSSPVLNVPSSISQSLMHPSQQQPSPLNRVSPGSATHLAHPHPYIAALHSHHHPLIQQSLFAAAAAAAVHHNPYSHHPYAAGYPYAFPYGPYPIPQPIPPPRPSDIQKRENETSGSTILTSHQSSSSSSSITTRSLRNDDSNIHSQEIMQTHHHSSSHHASIHHHSDKQTISHSTSSTSSASIHHKVKRSSSPQHSSSSCHVSATLSQSTSSTVSSANHGQNAHHSHHHHHQHQHQHQHAHHQHTHHHQAASTEPMSPLLNMSIPLGANNNNNNSNGNNNSNRNNPMPVFGNNSHQGKPSHPSVIPGASPVLPNHHAALTLSGLSPSGSLDALRAHAHAHALHVTPMQLQSSPHGIPPGHPAYMTGAEIHLNAPGSESIIPPPDEPLYAVLPEEDELPSPTHHIPKGPSPEPKVEDSECHRSQSAIFLRHWNRGDYNSCARTDLTFKPVPDSKLARTREERIRKQAEKDREEKEKAQSRKLSTPDKVDAVIKPPSRGPIETITSPYDRFTARGTPYAADTPALRQLSEYARPHTSFSPVTLQRSAASLGIPPQCIDPMLHYQLNMYGSARERLELEHFEREKRERELRELREKELNDRLKEEIMKSTGSRLPNPVDPHWLDLQRRFNALGPGAPGLNPFGLYPAAATPGQAPGLSPLERERLERLGANGNAYPRPTLLPTRDPSLGLHHPSDLLARPYADQLAHQAAAHEHLQRQMLLERERYPHPALVAQHEEYIRKLYLM